MAIGLLWVKYVVLCCSRKHMQTCCDAHLTYFLHSLAHRMTHSRSVQCTVTVAQVRWAFQKGSATCAPPGGGFPCLLNIACSIFVSFFVSTSLRKNYLTIAWIITKATEPRHRQLIKVLPSSSYRKKVVGWLVPSKSIRLTHCSGWFVVIVKDNW